MDSKSALHFTAILMLFLSTSVLGYPSDSSDTSLSVTSTSVSKNPNDSLLESFVDLLRQITTVQVQLEFMMRETEKQGVELTKKEKRIEKQKTEIKAEVEVLKQREEDINTTELQLIIREESINKTQIELRNQEQRVKTLEAELKQKEKDIESQKAEIEQKLENFSKAELEVAQKQENLRVREEKLKQKENQATCSIAWVKASGGHVPPNAIVGGKTSDGENLYVGRATLNGELLPGKIHPSRNFLYVSCNLAEYYFSEYEAATLVQNVNSSDKNVDDDVETRYVNIRSDTLHSQLSEVEDEE